MTGWRMARAPGGRRVAMRWIRKQIDNNERKGTDDADQQEAGDSEDERNQDGASGASRDEGGPSRVGALHRQGPSPSVHVRKPLGRKPVLAPLVPESSCLSAAVAACVASSYGAVPVRQMDDETTQVTVVARIGGAR